jgi:hypothetical protein
VREAELGRGGTLRLDVAPIVKELEEETPEGVIRKFVQRLPGGTAETATARAMPYYDIECVLIPMIGRASRQEPHALRQQPGRLRDGVHVLRDRADGPRSAR